MTTHKKNLCALSASAVKNDHEETLTPSSIYLKQARKIILRHLKDYGFQLFLFGSQSTQQAGRTSDIDVGILPMDSLPRGLLSEIREELEESHIPYPVDLVDLSRSDPEFLQRVREKGVIWSD